MVSGLGRHDQEICALQWGHPRKRVEGQKGAKGREKHMLLQWGHPRKRVEGCRCASACRACCPCFNGATPERGWKGNSCRDRNCSVLKLQWGHPRKRVEGERLTAVTSCVSPLQWGHPRKRVEGRRAPASRPANTRRFNGATPERGWKALGQLLEMPPRPCVASMGPPPKEGGRRPASIKACARPRQASMGPPPKEGGRGRLLRIVLGLDNASMGPPPKEGGRLHTTRSCKRAQFPCFNGATPERGWKDRDALGQRRRTRQLQWGHPRKRVEG